MPSFRLLCILTPLVFWRGKTQLALHSGCSPAASTIESCHLIIIWKACNWPPRQWREQYHSGAFQTHYILLQLPVLVRPLWLHIHRWLQCTDPARLTRIKGKKWEIGREKVSRCETVPISVVLCPSYFFFIPKGLTHISFAFVPIIHLPVGDWLGERGFNLFLPCSPCRYIYLASC